MRENVKDSGGVGFGKLIGYPSQVVRESGAGSHSERLVGGESSATENHRAAKTCNSI